MGSCCSSPSHAEQDVELSAPRAGVPAATIYMAIYNPLDSRDPCHWALYIHDPSGRESIHQLIDKFENGGYRVAEPRYDTRPNRSGMWRENVLCGYIPSARVNAARAMIQNQFVDNVSQTWNCQAWAMEALDTLQQVGLLTYLRDGRQRLLGMRQNWQ